MKKTLLSVLAAAAFAVGVGAASADEISGRILEIDAVAQTITLENGMKFTVSEDINLETVAPGQEVRVTFEKGDAGNLATQIGPPQN